MNKIFLEGRLTRDPEILTSANNKEFARFNLAVSSGKEDTDFITCICFEKNKETAEKYLSKGKRVIIIGRIKTGSYINKDGVKIPTFSVMVQEINLIDYKNELSSADTGSDSEFAYIPDDIDISLGEDYPFK